MPLYKVALDIIVELQRTHSLNGYNSTSLLAFALCTVIIVQLIQSMIINLTTTATNYIHAFIDSIKSLPKVIILIFLYRADDVLFIFLIEHITIQKAEAKLIEYNQSSLYPDIAARKRFINLILGGAILSIIPSILMYHFVWQLAFLTLYSLFILISVIGLILRSIYLSLLFNDIHAKYSSIKSDSYSQNTLSYQSYSDKLSSFLSNFFNGKINRKDYLIGTIINTVLIFLVAFVGLTGTQISNYSFISFVISFIVTIFWIMYGLSLIIRRLHDVNKGWFSILRLVIPFYGIYFYFFLYFKKGVNK